MAEVIFDAWREGKGEYAGGIAYVEIMLYRCDYYLMHFLIIKITYYISRLLILHGSDELFCKDYREILFVMYR
jgi:hypothetical protein